MRKFLLLCFVSFSLSYALAQSPAWTPVEGKLSTRWSAQVNASAPLPEYPRPQMVRDAWLNLNGLWDYAIRPKEMPDAGDFQGKILVPFAVESSLSGVGKPVGKENVVVYRQSVTLPSSFRN